MFSKKIFISQPMRGKTKEEIVKERDVVIEYLKKKYPDCSIIDSVLDLGENRSPVYYLSKSIELLSTADLAVFMPGYSKARGCRLEYLIATAYGIPVEVYVGDEKGEFTLPNWEADWVEQKYPNCNMITVNQVKELFYNADKDGYLMSLTKEELMAGYSLFLCVKCAEKVASKILDEAEDRDKALEVLNGIWTDEVKEIEEGLARTSIPKITITRKLLTGQDKDEK